MDMNSEMFAKMATALSFFPFSFSICTWGRDSDGDLINHSGLDGAKPPCYRLGISPRRVRATAPPKVPRDEIASTTKGGDASSVGCLGGPGNSPSHRVAIEDAMMPIRCMSHPFQRKKVIDPMSGDSLCQDELPTSMVLSFLRSAGAKRRTGQHIIRQKDGRNVLELASFSGGDVSSGGCVRDPSNSRSHSVAVEDATMPITNSTKQVTKRIQSKLVVPSGDSVCEQASILDFSSSARLARACQHIN